MQITNGSTEQIIASNMTNAALAQRLAMIVEAPRSFTRKERDAFLEAAATRLLWDDVYAKHNTWPVGLARTRSNASLIRH